VPLSFGWKYRESVDNLCCLTVRVIAERTAPPEVNRGYRGVAADR
jgi:hypothetical protein